MSEALSHAEHPIRLGVSSCLLGNEVRFDGGHKRDRFVTDLLGKFVEWVPVCPEVEVGMDTPRPALRLVRDGEDVRMVEIKSGLDHTDAMERYSARRTRELRGLDLCGYILKKNSPSCGMTRVKVYEEQGMATRQGRGLYASVLMDAYPNLPVEDEGRLNDSKLRENFIERVFAYQRLTSLFLGRWTRGQVVAFHTAHKLQLMAHSTVAYRELGRLVAELKQTPRAVFREEYERWGDARIAVSFSHESIGRALYYTSFTVVAGFSVLCFSNFVPTVLFGLWTAIAMLLALIANLTLLPALLVLTHRKRRAEPQLREGVEIEG